MSPDAPKNFDAAEAAQLYVKRYATALNNVPEQPEESHQRIQAEANNIIAQAFEWLARQSRRNLDKMLSRRRSRRR